MRDSERKTARAAKERIRYLASKLADYGFTRPERKFVFQMVFGILKQQSVILLQIARGLGEKAQLKKTVERLGKHLGRETLADRLMTALPQLARYKLRRCQYLVLDLSDVRKDYARKMEGLRPVYDGSKGEVAPGYWTVNVVGVGGEEYLGRELVPVYSELYSTAEAGFVSENAKVWKAIETVTKGAGKGPVWVFDRGFDRREGLLKPLMEEGYRFLIRQRGDRLVEYKGELLPVREVGKRVPLRWTYVLERRRGGRERKVRFRVGATQVSVPGVDGELWLVVVAQRGEGRSWYLGRLEQLQKNGEWELLSAEEAARRGFEAYGSRWSVEEVFRHVKTDYSMEKMRVQSYTRLRSLNAVLWFAMYFLYVDAEGSRGRLLLDYADKITLGRHLKELRGFVYYKIGVVIAWLFSVLVCPLSGLAQKSEVVFSPQLSLFPQPGL